jgi:hypothetical protein
MWTHVYLYGSRAFPGHQRMGTVAVHVLMPRKPVELCGVVYADHDVIPWPDRVCRTKPSLPLCPSMIVFVLHEYTKGDHSHHKGTIVKVGQR